MEFAPHNLQVAFRTAFYASVTSFGPYEERISDPRLAITELQLWERGPEFPGWQTAEGKTYGLIYLQALLLLIIEAENRFGDDSDYLLGTAVAQAYKLKLYLSGHGHADDLEDMASAEKPRLRVWWSLVVLDRLHAAGGGHPAFIRHDVGVQAPPGLKGILGETPFWLTRKSNTLLILRARANSRFPGLSRLLDRTAAVISHLDPDIPMGWAQKEQILALDMYSDDFRMDLPSDIDPTSHPLVFLAYWHGRMLLNILNPAGRPQDVMWAAREAAGLLLANPEVTSPLTQHIVALTSICLLELAKVTKTRDEANGILRDLIEAPTAPTTLDIVVAHRINQHLNPTESDEEATARGNLQKLADLATASVAETASKGDTEVDADAEAPDVGDLPFAEATNYEEMGFDPRRMLIAGYLNIARTSA